MRQLWKHTVIDREFGTRSDEYVTALHIDGDYCRAVTITVGDGTHTLRGLWSALMRDPYDGGRWFRTFSKIPAITSPGGNGLL